MELSEAIEIAKKFIDRFNFVANNQSKLWDNVEGMEAGAVLSRTLETLLKALDNSISKDKIKELIEEETNGVEEAKKENKEEMRLAHEYTRLTLKSLLEE